MSHVDTAFILGCAIPAGGAFRGGILRDPDLDDRGGRMTDAREMTRHFGGRWYGAYGVAPCPVCQPEGKTGQCALTLSDGSNGRLLAHCKKLGCGFGEILSAAGLQSGVYCPPDPLELARRERVEKAQASKRATQAKTIWDTAQPVQGTVADHYLRGRGITCLLPSTLRFHANCWHAATAKRHPALIAAVQGSGLPAVHRTYLCVDGAGKANIDPPKAVAAHKTVCKTSRHGLLEQMSQQFAFPEAPVTVLGKGRMLWHCIRQIEATEPAICQVQMHLFTNMAF